MVTKVTKTPCASCAKRNQKHRYSKGKIRGDCVACERLKAEFRRVTARGLKVSAASTDTSPPESNTPWKKVIGLFDWHFPYHSRAAWLAVLEWVSKEKPDVIVIGGDHGDWHSVSTHGDGFDASFGDDVASVDASLVQLSAAAPDAQIFYLEGNHETMLSRTVKQRYPALDSVLSIKEALKLEAKSIQWVPETAQPIRIGKLHIIHGHQEMKGKSVPKYPATKFEKYVPAAGDVLWFGHIHRFSHLSVARYGGQASIYSSGCGRVIDKGHGANSWLHGEETGWQNGILIGHVWENGRVSTTEVDIKNGQFEWGGRLYGKRGVPDGQEQPRDVKGSKKASG